MGEDMRWRERGRWVGKSVRDEERYGLESEGGGRERARDGGRYGLERAGQRNW